MNKVRQTLNYIRKKTKSKSSVGIILGSGLGILTEQINNAIEFSYKELPHFVSPTVPGHAGNFIIGNLFNRNVVIMQGRLHLYEGYNVEEITYPLWVMQALGVKKLLITNAAGAINEKFCLNDLMFIIDHINFLALTSLYNVSLMKDKDKFVDGHCAYDKAMLKLAQRCAISLGIKSQKGVYAAVSGPAYETPAEIRMLRLLGADAVGMSTVPEVIIANYLKMKVLGISCITNIAGNRPVTHQEVLETSKSCVLKLSKLIKAILRKI